MTGAVIRVRLLTLADLPAVAHIHRAAFPESALSRIGLGAIRRYYAWQMTGPHHSVAFGACAGGELAGFCFGGVYNGAVTGFLRQNRLYLLLVVALRPWLLTDPFFRERIIQAARILRIRLIPKWLRRKRKASWPARPSIQPEASFGILSIAVHPAHRGSGIGSQLMAEAERIALASGFTRMDLTVHTSNAQAIRFYEKQGWEKDLWNGEWRGVMVKTLLTTNHERRRQASEPGSVNAT
jgi:ribosomal protein S18 acetylase RimI-like enzyme